MTVSEDEAAALARDLFFERLQAEGYEPEAIALMWTAEVFATEREECLAEATARLRNGKG